MHDRPSMKKILIAFLVGFSFLFTSCGDSSEDVANDTMSVMEDLTEIVKGVNDGDDAEKAIKKIKALKDDLTSIKERTEKLDEGKSDEEKKAASKEFKEKYGEKMAKIEGELKGEMTKLPTSGTVGAADVLKAIIELMSEMSEM